MGMPLLILGYRRAKILEDMGKSFFPHGSDYPNAYRESSFKNIMINKPNEKLFTRAVL